MLNKTNFFITFFVTVFMLIVLSLGIGGVLYSVKKLYNNFSLVISGTKTIGEIKGHYSNSSSRRNSGSTVMYTSIIEFKDINGKPRKLISDYSSSVPDNYDTVTIYYNKNNPHKAVIGGFLTVFFWPFLILLFSILALGIGWSILDVYIEYFKKKIFKK